MKASGRLGGRVRSSLVDADSATSLAASLRARRWHMFLERFPDFSDMRVIDLGGTSAYWSAAPVRPAELLIVNLSPQAADEAGIRSIVGDVCVLPPQVTRERFDIAYSNSVIEHVGGHAKRTQMADVVAQLSDHHWVQTPYRYFPIEPHWVFPGFQFLPTNLKARASEVWPFAWSRPDDWRGAVQNALDVELLDRTQLEYYFPDSTILTERVVGLPKSLVAVR